MDNNYKNAGITTANASIYKAMGLSTAHIDKTTIEKIIMGEIEFVIYPKDDYGWFVLVSNWNDNLNPTVPDDLKDCLEYAAKHECDWIIFDPDEDIVDDLPVYFW